MLLGPIVNTLLRTDSELRQEPRTDKTKLRLAASSPNIKALFDANPTTYGYRDSQQQQQQESGYPGFYPPVPPIPQLPPHPQQQGEYQWAPPRQMVRSLRPSETDPES